MRLLPLTLLLAGSLMAQQPPGPGPMRHQGTPQVAALKDALGLSDVQVTQLTQIMKDRNAAVQPMFSQIRDKRTSLREKLNAGSSSASDVGQLEIDIAALQKQIPEVQKQYIDKARSVLNADQLNKLKTIEDAAKLMPAVREATVLSLIEGPEPGARALWMPAGGPGMMMRRHAPGPR